MGVTVLAVDPGASSGWAIAGHAPVEWGVVSMKNVSSAQLIRMIVEKAHALGATTLVIEGPYKLRMPRPKGQTHRCATCGQDVPEDGQDAPYEPGWKTYYGMGTARGRWEQEARFVGLKIHEVNPRTWQAATVGTGPRPKQIEKYRARAKSLARSQKTIAADAAAAICIADWWRIREAVKPPWSTE